MYIGHMRPHASGSAPRLPRPGHVTPARTSRIRIALAGLLLSLPLAGLSGCLFDSPPPKAIPRPSILNPEVDAFLKTTARTYTWSESFRRAGKTDTVLAQGSFEVSSLRDTLIGGETRPFFDLPSFSASNPAPAAALSRAGFRASRVHFDTVRVPDPGPSYRFPDTPAVGWRLDTIVGDLRFVRQLKGVETITQYGVRHQTWAFAESTWWQDESSVLLGTGTTWMGRTGLVRHQSLWPGFPSHVGEGTLVRTVIAP